MRPFRLAALSLAALVVLSLGFTFIPGEKPAAAGPTFSERARAAAFTDAMDLRAAGMGLASGGAVDSTTVNEVVTLLTIQARALLPASPGPASSPPAPPASAAPAPAAATGVAGLVQALAASGAARVKDAEAADGGMARLLAGTGTAQLLAAGHLAAVAGVPGPQAASGSDPALPLEAPSSACPSPTSPAAAAQGSGPVAPAGAQQALAAAATAEQQATYGYQAALPRLASAEAGPASEFLNQHKDLAASAEGRLRLACGASVPQQPGYILDSGFLASPAAGLGRLETATLASYGDVVALSQGQDRLWALSALRSAAGRATHWGADAGPVPGLPLDLGQLPVLPGGGIPTASPAAS